MSLSSPVWERDEPVLRELFGRFSHGLRVRTPGRAQTRRKESSVALSSTDTMDRSSTLAARSEAWLYDRAERQPRRGTVWWISSLPPPQGISGNCCRQKASANFRASFLLLEPVVVDVRWRWYGRWHSGSLPFCRDSDSTSRRRRQVNYGAITGSGFDRCACEFASVNAAVLPA